MTNHHAFQLIYERMLEVKFARKMNFRALNFLMSETLIKENDDMGKRLKGNSLWINKNFAPELYKMCEDVLNTLKVEEKIEFYLLNNASFNAYAFYSREENIPHKIILNSELFEKLTDDELKFVIGHEVGHLLLKHSLIQNYLLMVYPKGQSEKPIPERYKNNYWLWEKLCEFSADRFGYLAVKDINKVMSSIFRLNVGVGSEVLMIDDIDYNKLNEEILNKYTDSSSTANSSHPSIPQRYKAIQIFSESELYKKFVDGDKLDDYIDEELAENMSELINKMLLAPNTERDKAVVDYLFVSGLIIAMADDEVKESELELHKELMAERAGEDYISENYPNLSNEELYEVQQNAIEIITEKYPSEATEIFYQLVKIAIVDKKLCDEEMRELIKSGTALNLPHHRIIECISLAVKYLYNPFNG